MAYLPVFGEGNAVFWVRRIVKSLLANLAYACDRNFKSPFLKIDHPAFTVQFKNLRFQAGLKSFNTQYWGPIIGRLHISQDGARARSRLFCF